MAKFSWRDCIALELQNQFFVQSSSAGSIMHYCILGNIFNLQESSIWQALLPIQGQVYEPMMVYDVKSLMTLNILIVHSIFRCYLSSQFLLLLLGRLTILPQHK